ncbi:glycosyltransferase family 4 protein [Nodularia spumigena]|uniref:Glycosyltransferase n=1 Tax=Nodularia spumigena UHCC 0060 TaxID=3110300 RepID=A0ABU5UVJ2_NODSP|nr:glycosyltransferase [Nodularia spumigena]MEA5527543.1 glycosyltransferase [Nodularia spumigena UHCC 0143]MEA5610324.1 glycosyltransferase [Nodularia spumigena UHCC 0060]MEA5613611.1 glycosyltransferase [Nodularia spumigena UHCC 0040]
MIKLTLIITGLNTGGAEMMLLKLIERLSPEFTPQVISLTDIGAIGERIQSLGIPVTALGMSRTIPNPLALLKLVKLLKHSQPDIVHTWMYHADLLGGLAARMAGVSKVIWNIRHSDLSKEKSKATTRLVAAFCAKISHSVPDRILSCSQVGQKIHINIGYMADKFVVIANGSDLERFQPNPNFRESVRQELGIAADTPLVGVIARFDPQKNHTGFFTAAGYLHQKRPDVHFLLAGSGIDTDNSVLMRAIDKAQVSHVTHLLGLRQDIPRLMASLDVLVSPSSYGEGFPNVLGEAMGCGVPCVVTDVGDSAYIVGDTGKVVAPDDMIGLAEAIDSLLSLPSSQRLTLGEQARHRIQENFEINHVVSLYESLYQEVYTEKFNS